MDLIVGAGITGLSYAAATSNDYLVIEKEPEIGGYCRTILQDGFIWDYSGHFFHFRNKDIERFVMDKMHKDRDIITLKKMTQIRYKNKHIDYPFQKNIHQLDKAEFIDCLYDLFVNEYREGTTFKSMPYAKFGKSIAEIFLIPYNEKLYACDLDELDPDAMGRFFPYADKQEIIANFKHAKENSYNATFEYPKGGAFEYVNSVFQRIDPKKVATGEALVELDIARKIARTTRRSIKYDQLISTIPLPKLLSLSGIEHDTHLYSSNKVLVFNLGFDRKGNEKRNHWLYFPEKKYIFYRVGFYDNIFNSDRLSAYVEIGFRQDAQIDINACLTRVLKDLETAGIISGQKLVSSHSVIMDPAYVHVTSAMEKDRAEKMKTLSSYDVYSIGRYGGWYYCSIEDNVAEALSLARRISHE